jgi:hypothetical protein
MKLFGIWGVACLLAGLTGCTAQQWFVSGQSWQRNQCVKLMDTIQRNRCLDGTWMSYDQYETELHADARRRQSSQR